MNRRTARAAWTGPLILAAAFLAPRAALAHCDTIDGPVVAAARQALDRGDATPVLKWVKPEREPEIRAALARTLPVRKLGDEARDLADTWFFETVVRLHRLGEGASYEGLKPAGTDPGPAVRAADHALESGSDEQAVRLVTEAVTHGLRERFHRAIDTRAAADQSVEQGRRFVAAYVEFVHYVERVYEAATTPAHAHAEHPAEAGSEHSAEAHAEHRH